jgi:hypothetical protein
MAAASALEILGSDEAVHKLLVRESPILSPELQARDAEVRPMQWPARGNRRSPVDSISHRPGFTPS